MGRIKRWTWIVMAGFLFLLTPISFGADSKPPRKSPELLKEGRKIYDQICATCHGSNGDGKGAAGAVLKPPPSDFRNALKEWPNTKGDPRKIFEVISKGIPNSGMVAWTQYTEQQRWALVYTVMEFAARPGKK